MRLQPSSVITALERYVRLSGRVTRDYPPADADSDSYSDSVDGRRRRVLERPCIAREHLCQQVPVTASQPTRQRLARDPQVGRELVQRRAARILDIAPFERQLEGLELCGRDLGVDLPDRQRLEPRDADVDVPVPTALLKPADASWSSARRLKVHWPRFPIAERSVTSDPTIAATISFFSGF